MDKKIIITKLTQKHSHEKDRTSTQKHIITALFEDDQIAELGCSEETSGSILGNIYIGKVENVVKNINAAFIDIGSNTPCYYSIEDNKAPIFTIPKKDNTLHAGDELLVQISKEKMKTKAPVVTSNLNFSGKYLVLTSGNKKLGISSKIKSDHRERIKTIISARMKGDFGMIIRTNAQYAQEEEILKEFDSLSEMFRSVMRTAQHRTAYSLLYQTPPEYITNLRDTYTEGLQRIITDCTDLYNQIESYMKNAEPEALDKLSLYDDSTYPLSKLYSIENRLDDALREKVWLKSGAYLIIQPTEALVVVDVNSGKFSGKKNIQQTFLKINLEAAKEIARQLRLRNLSGIIIVDFIDMEKEEDRQQLLKTFESYLKKDPVKTSLIGMSSLHLVELTRKKVKKPLKESLTIQCPVCQGTGFLY